MFATLMILIPILTSCSVVPAFSRQSTHLRST